MSTRDRFVIIDGHALAYRQYFALPVQAFRTRAGEPTNATYGFTRTLLDLLLGEKPEYLAVSFDRGLSGREELYEEYKGTREKMPDDLRSQIERIEEMVQAFNIPVLAQEGYEADDVIGTVVRLVADKDLDVLIITGDRDILQLLSERVRVQLPGRRGQKDVIWTLQAFRDHYGLEPWQLVELKGLMGDSSDNIPGVKGIGEKSGTTLLQQFESIAGVYEHIEDVRGAMRKRLEAGTDMARISRELAMIKRDVPLSLSLDYCVAHDFDLNQVQELMRTLEFRSLSDRLKDFSQIGMFAPEETAAATTVLQAVDDVETVLVNDEADLTDMVAALESAGGIVWDVETTSVDQMSCDLVGIALAVDGDRGWYVPVGHSRGQQLPLQRVLDALRGPLTDPDIPKYAHNAAYDLVVLQRYGIDVTPVAFDTMLAQWLFDTSSKFLGLKNFARFVLEPPVEMTEISELLGTGRKQISMAEVEIDNAAPYAAADGAITWRAVDHLRPRMEVNLALNEVFTTLELPLVPVIADLERAGVVLDTQHLQQLSHSLGERLRELEETIYGLSGGYGAFNINSPRQLNDVLFGKLGLPTNNLRRTTHGFSTNAETLEKLRPFHEIIGHISEHRELGKLKGTYVDSLPDLINSHTGRLHTSYNQTGTSTGRISSNNPNLQNIPIRTEPGREVRRAFVPQDGSQLLSVDYNQIELRVMAHFCEDPTLLEAFQQEQDIHSVTAATVFAIPLEEVSYQERDFAKRVNFGLMYGMGAFGLASDSDMSVKQAREFIADYFGRMPRVRDWIDATKQQARQGPLTTLFGRRHEFPVLLNASRSNAVAVSRAERVAINLPIQGSAAEIMKRAMLDVHAALAANKLDARMILQVHDELVLEVPNEQLAETGRLVVEVMEAAVELKAPLRANAEVGLNWRDMQPLPL
ncbi:MAG: DNA polymerase I [Anaerolineaceae bacterium]|nr:DNA polymerase I [Anaerolineaceae bacterium]MCY4024650.1 DNA polymerase I [Anaerolineaceae bacterium]